MRTEINFVLVKNGGHRPNSLGCRLIAVVRQADDLFAVCKILKFDNFNCKARLGCLNGFMVPIALYIIDKQPVFEGNVIERLVFHTREAIYSMSIPTIKYYRT